MRAAGVGQRHRHAGGGGGPLCGRVALLPAGRLRRGGALLRRLRGAGDAGRGGPARLDPPARPGPGLRAAAGGARAAREHGRGERGAAAADGAGDERAGLAGRGGGRGVGGRGGVLPVPPLPGTHPLSPPPRRAGRPLSGRRARACSAPRRAPSCSAPRRAPSSGRAGL